MTAQKPKNKPTPFRDIPVGERVFTLTRMDDETTHEIRETYYTKISDVAYLHYGCIQCDPALLEEGELPRYMSPSIRLHRDIFAVGHQYPMIPTLPVFPLSESKFAKLIKKD